MASFGEEDNILQENSGRRTRSGRSSAPIHPLELPTRTNRRSRKTAQLTVPEDEVQPDLEVVESSVIEIEDSSSIIMEMVAEATQGVLGGEIIYDKGIYEHTEEVIIEETGTIGDEDIEIYSGVDDEQINCELRLPESAGIDEKSSSFPFATAAQSETSEENQNEEERLNPSSEPVESSLLASLAGDNANSLPSEAGNDENDNKKLFGSKVSDKLDSSDSVSEPALAEDLENGNGTASDATIQNAEIISEDELPTTLKPSINDAEEVSDDELPAPKRAELPADSEIISEDELPSAHAEKRSESSIIHKDNSKESSKSTTNSSNKHKRKHEDKHKSSEDHNKKVESKKSRSSEQYNPMSPTSESNDSSSAEKKPKIEDSEEKEKRRDKNKEKEKSDEDKEKSHREEPDKEKEKEKEKEKKRLPDLDRYWKAVTDDPADFTAWTYLLQYVDNETDAEAAREAYDAFLSQYPYCYGYWRKYADYEKRVGIKANCNAVFERGLEAIPLSVDLWIHYLTHVKNTQADDEQYIRSQFKRAVDVCGFEFRSDKLWDAFIKWESDYKRYNQVLIIYDRLLGIPTQGYNSHFHGFQNLIHQHPITNILSKEELVKLRKEINTNVSKRKNKDMDESSDTEDYKSPSSCKDDPDERHSVWKDDGKDENKDYSDFNTLTEEEITLIKTKVISLRRKFYRNTVESITARWSFEEGIKRPYFHVKPLERCQLKNWKDYLDFEIEQGDLKRILVLFERCLIACALYDEFWLKMIRFLETKMDNPDIPDITRDVFRRACQIHHPDKPSLHLMWAAFEECRNNFNGAAEVLVNIEKKCPNLLQITYRRINLERRRGDLIKCRELYEHYIENAKNKNIAGSLAIKYARFLNKICHDLDGGLQVLRKVLEKDPGNTRVVLQMIDLALQREKVDEDEVVLIMDKFMARENIDLEQKVLFAQRKVEFLEDFGSTAKGLQDAQRSLQLALSKANELKKKKETPPTPECVTAVTNTSQPGYNNAATSSSSNTTNYNYNAANSAYYNQQGATAYQQQSYDNYYNQWQYGSNNYGYGQWSGYGKYY